MAVCFLTFCETIVRFMWLFIILISHDFVATDCIGLNRHDKFSYDISPYYNCDLKFG